ncbi:hypothetical protein F5884DRAFT_790516 [Xylogone sp. PMI_703]|nr:hypothetical protein F5884DRAFT_790516 [Xylogone sp. PMI_703]
MHLCGALMLGENSMPFRKQFMFFIWQAIGISIQSVFQIALRSTKDRFSYTWKTFNFLFCISWLALTFPILFDDFKSCGIWQHRVLQLW